MSHTRSHSILWNTALVFIVCASPSLMDVTRAKVPLPNSIEEFGRLARVRDMEWVPTLSAAQIKEVRLAVDSRYGPLTEAAIVNVFIHRLDDLLPVIEATLAQDGRMEMQPFRKLCADVVGRGGNVVEKLRRFLEHRLPGDAFTAMDNQPTRFRPVRAMVSSLIVIMEVRAVRAGRQNLVDVTGLELGDFERTLVKFSLVDPNVAIRTIVDEISRAKIARPHEYNLIQVLRTYPPEQYLPEVLDRLERNSASEGYGTMLLFHALRFRCDRLDAVQKTKLRAIIKSVRRINKKPSVENVMAALEADL